MMTFQSRLLSVQRNLLNFALILTSNRDDAYDLVQDTTLKALDNSDKYTESSNFKGWIFTIMRNIFINNYRRSTKVITSIDSTDDQYYLNLPQDSGLDSPEDSYSVTEITSTIGCFRDDYRIPFSMHLAGYHYAEIASRMHLPVGTIKSRIYYTRKRLRSILNDYR